MFVIPFLQTAGSPGAVYMNGTLAEKIAFNHDLPETTGLRLSRSRASNPRRIDGSHYPFLKK